MIKIRKNTSEDKKSYAKIITARKSPEKLIVHSATKIKSSLKINLKKAKIILLISVLI